MVRGIQFLQMLINKLLVYHLGFLHLFYPGLPSLSVYNSSHSGKYSHIPRIGRNG